MTIELALTPDSRWEIDTAGLVTVAGDAGFTALGLGVAHADATAAAALAQQGVRCHELLALMVSTDADATWNQALRLAEAAQTVDAQWVLTVFRDGLNNETADIIRRCAALFSEAGVGMAAEFSPLGPVSSIAAALEIVDVAGVDRAGVMIDSWHFSHGDSTWEQLEQIPLERIAYVQFDDALAPISEKAMSETMNRRCFPGDGVLELDRFAGTLRERGWDGLVSVEVLSAELRQLPVAEFAKQAYDKTAPYWR